MKPDYLTERERLYAELHEKSMHILHLENEIAHIRSALNFLFMEGLNDKYKEPARQFLKQLISQERGDINEMF